MRQQYVLALRKLKKLSLPEARAKGLRWQRCQVIQQVRCKLGGFYSYSKCVARFGETEGFGGELCAGAGPQYRGDSPARNQVKASKYTTILLYTCLPTIYRTAYYLPLLFAAGRAPVPHGLLQQAPAAHAGPAVLLPDHHARRV